MKSSLLLAVLLLTSGIACSQTDPGIQAAQQANQAAMQANQQAIADLQHFSDQNALANQQAVANAANIPFIVATLPPKISVKSGSYTRPITVKLGSRTRGSIMYYTTDGWTPTTTSTRYTGPITIDATTTLRAIAVSPYAPYGRSLVISAVYTFPASSTPSSETASAPAPANGPQPVRLLFARDVNSKTAEIGDKIPLTLADDVVLDGTVIARKGAPASVTIIQVDKTGAAGAPGNLEFQIDPLQTDGGLLKLRGSASLEGQAAPPNAAFLIPVVGLFTLLHHGHDAVIKSGTPFVAYLDPVASTGKP